MNSRRADNELAYGELHHAFQEHGDTPEFQRVCLRVEQRLIAAHPDDEAAIIEMVAAWLVHMGATPDTSLHGKV